MWLIGPAVVLAVGIALAPLVVAAQQSGKAPRIGMLLSGTLVDPDPRVAALRQALGSAATSTARTSRPSREDRMTFRVSLRPGYRSGSEQGGRDRDSGHTRPRGEPWAARWKHHGSNDHRRRIHWEAAGDSAGNRSQRFAHRNPVGSSKSRADRPDEIGRGCRENFGCRPSTRGTALSATSRELAAIIR